MTDSDLCSACADTLISYPAIFSAPMVRGLLREVEELGAGKTQTRRGAWIEWTEATWAKANRQKSAVRIDPRGKPSPWLRRYERWQEGERPWLWVKETFMPGDGAHDLPAAYYRATDAGIGGRWTPSIHMPKWASRLSLRVTDMRREQLQDISGDDAIAVGCTGRKNTRQISLFGAGRKQRAEIYWINAPHDFADVWRDIHGPDSWDANPEIIAVTFEVHQQNIERIAA
jgi:hypothetical protein